MVYCINYDINEKKCKVKPERTCVNFEACKNDGNACAKKEAKVIGDLADNYVMSHNVFALRLALKDEGNLFSLKNFEEELKAKVQICNDSEKKERVNFDPFVKLDFLNSNGLGNRGPSIGYAGIFSSLIKNEHSKSYELRLNIHAPRNKKTFSYDKNDVLEEKCFRFVVGHELGHAVLNLKDLIKNVNNNQIKNYKQTSIEDYEADIFSHILSNLRDFQQIFPKEEFNFKDVQKILDNMPGVSNAKKKIIKEYNKSDEYCNDRILEILKRIEVLDSFSQSITMSHLIPAL